MERIALDFDGVLNNYEGWKGENELYTPRAFVDKFLKELSQKYEVVIITSRDSSKVTEWLIENSLETYVREVTNTKLPALCYVDDRAIPFCGDYFHTLKKIDEFSPHWQKKTDLHKKAPTQINIPEITDKIINKIREDSYKALQDITQLQQTLKELREMAIVEAYDTRNLIHVREIDNYSPQTMCEEPDMEDK